MAHTAELLQIVTNAEEFVQHADGWSGDEAWHGVIVDGLPILRSDVESTASHKEALPHFGKKRGIVPELNWITEQVQMGNIPFDIGLRDRLDATQPNARMLAEVDDLYVQTLAPYATELVNGLKLLNVETEMITMGFKNVMHGLGDLFGVPIYGGEIFLDSHGNYAGYADGERLAHVGGKRMEVEVHGREEMFEESAALGDGVEDMRMPAKLHIGYKRYAQRDAVRQLSDVYTDSLAVVLVLVSGEKGWKKLSVCKDKRIAQALFDGMYSILRGEVEFKNKALELAYVDRILRFLEPRDQDVVVYQYKMQ